jgi:hypothetical protein
LIKWLSGSGEEVEKAKKKRPTDRRMDRYMMDNSQSEKLF